MILGLSIGAILTACESGSKQRACEPVLQVGCSSGQTCGLDRDGVPACVAIGEGVEGDSCVEASDCGDGLGCIRLRGVARCLRFCAPSADSSPCADDSGTHPHSEFAECIGVAIDRADIGICVLPCTPAEPHCPDALGCGPVAEAGMAMCQPIGVLGADEDCDGRQACGEGLACVAHGERFVCRRYDLDGCGEAAVSISVPGILDVVNEAEIRVCATCVALGQIGAAGEMVTACPALVTAEASCEAEGGASPRIIDRVHAEFLTTLFGSLLKKEPENPREEVPTPTWWTGARKVEGVWRWPDGTPVDLALIPVQPPVRTLPEDPKAQKDCAVWRAGFHEARHCNALAASVCALAPEGAAE